MILQRLFYTFSPVQAFPDLPDQRFVFLIFDQFETVFQRQAGLQQFFQISEIFRGDLLRSLLSPSVLPLILRMPLTQLALPL